MTIVHSASALNNRALAILFDGDKRGSLLTFQCALRCIRTAFADNATPPQGVVKQTAGGMYPVFEEVRVSLEGLQGDEYFIYDRLMAISSIGSCQDNGTKYSELCIALGSSVVMFNIAQVHLHTARLSVPGRASGSYVSLQRAVEFYRMSLQLLERASACLAGPKNDEGGGGVPVCSARAIHALAILGLNNMAIAYSELKVGERSRSCLKELSRQLSRDVPAKSDDQDSTDHAGFLIGKADIVGIYLNLMRIGQTEQAPAA